MRAVLVHVPDAVLADRLDEMWDGVLHMTPAPSVEHQRIVDALVEFLRPRLRESGRGTLLSQINVFQGETDFRIPDLTFIAAGREHVLRHDGTRGEGPDAVIEIRSPDDETYDKLPFYAALGVREVIVCQRDSKEREIFKLAGSQYVAVQRDAEGVLLSDVLGARFTRTTATPPRLRLDDTLTPGGAEI